MSQNPAVARLVEKGMTAARVTGSTASSASSASSAPTNPTRADSNARIAQEIASVRAALSTGTDPVAAFDSIRRNHPEDAQAVADALRQTGGAS